MDDPARRSALENGSSLKAHREDDAAPASVWPLVVFGTVAAIAVAWLACRVPVPLKTSGWKIVLRAVLVVVFTAQAGFLGVMAARRRRGVPGSVTTWQISLQAGLAWVFFPCVALFYFEKSVWMLVWTVIAAAILAMSLRGFFPDRSRGAVRESLTGADGVPAFAELPVEREGWWHGPVIALCVQASLFPILMGWLLSAAILLAVCSGLLVWSWSGARLRTEREDERAALRRLVVTAVAAILILWRALIPWSARMGSIEHAGNVGKRQALFTHKADQETGFVGIILLPPAEKKVKMVAPAPERDATRAAKAAEPMVIPFDGAYWYFKAPFREPGARAHVVHGRPTLVNIHSTDFFPLLMEAHQRLGTAIDPGCCGEIEMAITNADTRPGRIGVEVILTDTGSPMRPSMSLGEKVIVSSEAEDIPINRGPVEEVLRFPVPQALKVQRFDEITVLFLPARERARGGAKVSIRSFRLIPR